MGYSSVPTYLWSPSGPMPAALALRTREAMILGRRYDGTLDFGTQGNRFFLGLRYRGADGATVVLRQLGAATDLPLSLEVSAGPTLAVSDSFGNRRDLPVRDGTVSLNVPPASQLDALNPLGLGLGPALPIGPAEISVRRGREGEGVTEYLRVAALRGATTAELESLRAGHASAGMTGFWRAWLEMDLRQSGSSPDPRRIAATWAMIGHTERTFEWLDRAYAERNPGLIYLGSDPSFRSVRTHPRFLRIRREMGLER